MRGNHRFTGALSATIGLTLSLALGTAGATASPPAPASASVPASVAVTASAEPISASASAAFARPLYVESNTDAAKSVARLRTEGNEASASLIDQIASQPTAIWLGDWYTTALLRSVIKRNVDASRAQGTTLVFVTYAIPNRDCGGYSAGGHTNAEYLDWNREIAADLQGTAAVILIEPDSLAMLADAKCAGTAATRLPLLRDAVAILAAAGLSTYLDGGNSRWLSPSDQAAWLTSAGIAGATGFYTNVANYNPVAVERDYAGKVSSRVGLKHYVIDVSRNGRGWTGTWCNSPGAGLGQNPRVTPDSGKLDAVLWIKHPGASDGTCNGGPTAGAWFEKYALDLVRNR